LICWFAFQNQSVLAAEALVDTVVALYRTGWTVEQLQLELTFLSLQDQSEGMQQMQSLDRELLTSFLVLIWLTCEVRTQHRQAYCSQASCYKSRAAVML
jgi:hypothetical protein